jgi:hypothetical protein
MKIRHLREPLQDLDNRAWWMLLSLIPDNKEERSKEM